MSLKFSKDAGRVQPTPAICKKPPIPKPPGTPLECIAANLYFRGYAWIAPPPAFAGIFILHRSISLSPQLWHGSANADPWTFQLTVAWNLGAPNGTAMLHGFLDGIPRTINNCDWTAQRTDPLDSGIIDDWYFTPPDTTIHLRLLG